MYVQGVSTPKVNCQSSAILEAVAVPLRVRERTRFAGGVARGVPARRVAVVIS
jgi:hypothetical protein